MYIVIAAGGGTISGMAFTGFQEKQIPFRQAVINPLLAYKHLTFVYGVKNMFAHCPGKMVPSFRRDMASDIGYVKQRIRLQKKKIIRHRYTPRFFKTILINIR